MNIGIFDSGIGGINVLKEAVELLPNENFIYYADTKNVPYGTKTKEEVKRLIFEAVEFLAGFDLKMLVVACNTATSIAVRELREKYSFPVIGMEPAVKPAVEKTADTGKRVLVTATVLTLQEEKFHNLVDRVDQRHVVDALPLQELVDFAEKLRFDENVIIPYLREKLKDMELSQYGTVVLGCTHFPFFKSSITKVFGEGAEIIDGSAGTVRYMKKILNDRGLLNPSNTPGSITFFSSDKDGGVLEKLRKAYNFANKT